MPLSEIYEFRKSKISVYGFKIKLQFLSVRVEYARKTYLNIMCENHPDGPVDRAPFVFKR